jgi:hypothetical protein
MIANIVYALDRACHHHCCLREEILLLLLHAPQLRCTALANERERSNHLGASIVVLNFARGNT